MNGISKCRNVKSWAKHVLGVTAVLVASLGMASTRPGLAMSEEAVMVAVVRLKPPRGDPEASDALLQALDAAKMAEDQRYLYYRAVALAAKGQRQEALKVAEAAVQTGFKPTRHEAETLARQLRWELTPRTREADVASIVNQRVRDTLAFHMQEYPYGQEETDRVNYGLWEDRFEPKSGWDSPQMAGDLYAEMHMYDSARRMYNRVIGFLAPPESRRLAGTNAMLAWQGMAHTYRAEGKWELAQAYYLKASVAAGLTEDRRKWIGEMGANFQQRKQVEVPRESPDVVKLERIVVLCAKTELFADAFEAMRQIEEQKVTASKATQIALNEAMLGMLLRLQKTRQINARLRGLDATTTLLETAQQRFIDLKRPER